MSLSNNEYGICNSCEEKRKQDKNITTHHVTIKTEKLRELIDKNKVIDLDYKEEYYKLQKENYKLKQKIEEYQEALLNICSK